VTLDIQTACVPSSYMYMALPSSAQDRLTPWMSPGDTVGPPMAGDGIKVQVPAVAEPVNAKTPASWKAATST